MHTVGGEMCIIHCTDTSKWKFRSWVFCTDGSDENDMKLAKVSA